MVAHRVNMAFSDTVLAYYAKVGPERLTCALAEIAGNKKPALGGLLELSLDQAFLRLEKPKPAMPRPNRAKVAGSGTCTTL